MKEKAVLPMCSEGSQEKRMTSGSLGLALVFLNFTGVFFWEVNEPTYGNKSWETGLAAVRSLAGQNILDDSQNRGWSLFISSQELFGSLASTGILIFPFLLPQCGSSVTILGMN